MDITIEPVDWARFGRRDSIARDAHTALSIIGMRLEAALADVPQVTALSLSLSEGNNRFTWPTYRFSLAVPVPFATLTTHHHSDEDSAAPRGETINLSVDVIDQDELTRVIEHTVQTVIDHVKRLLNETLGRSQDTVRQLVSAIQSLEPTSVN